MSTAELSGLRAVVTGSSRGFGAAVARDLVGRGARVVISGTDTARAAAIAEELNAPVLIGSVADESIAEALVSTCVAEFGGIDLLVNNAGVARDGMLVKASVDDFDAVIGVHLRGCWLASRAAARAMGAEGGSILNVVSGTALYGNLGQSSYAAAKGGMLAMTRALALELRRKRIRVNALAPVVLTEMVEPLLRIDPALADSFGTPQDVAPIVGLLASATAADLSGLAIGFDGRRLTAWSHPLAEAVVEVDHGKGFDGLADALARLPHLTPNPDAFGRSVLSALGVDPAVV